MKCWSLPRDRGFNSINGTRANAPEPAMALRTHAFSAMRSRRRSRSRERERETERENERENVGGAGETTSHVAENPHGAKIQNVADQVAEQSSGNTVGEAGLRGGEDGDRVLVDVDGSSGAVDVGARKLDNTMTSTSASGISVAGLAEAPAMPLSATLPNRSISKISVGRRQSVSSMLAKSVKFGADTSISHDTGTLNRPGLHKWTSLRSKVGALSSFASTTALPIPSRTLSEMDANLEAWQESDHEETADKTTEDNDPSFPSLPSLPPDQLPGHEPGGPIIPSEEHDFGIASATLDGNAIRINRIPGAGPGLDASKWSHSLRAQLSVSSTVRIVDYSADRIRSLPVITTTEELEEAVKQRPEWAATRWICVDGISLDVIGVLANEFGLHPLAVEDVFHFPQRVKVDFCGYLVELVHDLALSFRPLTLAAL